MLYQRRKQDRAGALEAASGGADPRPAASSPSTASATGVSGTYRAQQSTLLDDELRISLDSIPSLEKDRFLLTILSGPGKGSVFKLDGETVTLGRSDEADITLPDPSLSRIHARFTLIGHGPAVGFLIEDCNSTNGSFVGGEAVTKPTFLTDGARVSLGKRTIASFSVQDALEEQATISVHDSALNDGLTQVYNRRVFDDRLKMEFAFAARHGRPLSLIILDVDHFKAFNDNHGHQAGDLALQLIAAELKKTLRVEDLVARYGGEEFVVLARDTLPTEAALVAERLRSIIQHTPIHWQGAILQAKASVGVACNFPAPESADALLTRADEALYEAKRTGRNRVVVYGADRQLA